MPESTLFTIWNFCQNTGEREREEGRWERHTNTQTDREAGKRKERAQIDRQTDRMTDTEERKRDKDGDGEGESKRRERDRQTETDTEAQRERERETWYIQYEAETPLDDMIISSYLLVRCMGSPPGFSAILSKEDNFYHYLCVFIDNKNGCPRGGVGEGGLNQVIFFLL